MADNNDQSMSKSEAANMSSGKFGSPNGADPHKAGQQGAANQPREAKVEGGERGGSQNNRSDAANNDNR